MSLAGHRDAEAADLADRLGDPLEHLRVVVHDPVAAEQSPGLLIGKEPENEVTRRFQTRSCEMADIGQHHGVHILHVDRTSPPDAAVPQLRGERIHLPVNGIGRHDIEVSMNGQSRTASIRSVDTHKDTGAPGCALDVQGVEPDLGELPHHVLGTRPLAGAGTVPRVARVDPDQIAADTSNFGLRSRGVSHALNPSSRFGCGPSCVLSFPLVAGASTSTCRSPCPGGGMADALA